MSDGAGVNVNDAVELVISSAAMISLSVALLTALLRPPPSNWAARAPATQRAAPSTQIRMAAPSTLPRNIKEVVAQMKDAVQTALQNRISRIDVELPLGVELGIESEQKRKRGAKLSGEAVLQSDRELARVFLGMFEGTGLKPLVLFSEAALVEQANQKWLPEDGVRVLCLDPARAAGGATVKIKKPASSKGFGGGGAAAKPKAKAKAKKGPVPLAAVPADAEVVFAVAPGPKQMAALQEFCENSGMDRLVILLNARLQSNVAVPAATRDYFVGEFTQVYAFVTEPLAERAAEVAGGGGGELPPVVLWRAFPGEFVLAKKPAIGAPTELLRSADRPSDDEMREAIAADSSAGGVIDGLADGIKEGIDSLFSK